MLLAVHSFGLNSLLTVEIWFGLFAYCGKSVWFFGLTVPPVGLVFSANGSPTVSKKTNRKQRDLNVSKKTDPCLLLPVRLRAR